MRAEPLFYLADQSLQHRQCLADLEVRYTQAITLPNGNRAMRSGCLFLTPCPQLAALAKRVLRN